MRIIGLTGSIACGKTTVSSELVRLGFPVIDGDAISHELTGPGGGAVRQIASVFGSRYLLPDGSLDRKAMGSLVFSDSAARSRLDALMNPLIKEETLRRIEHAKASGARLCFLDMPLLFEKGYDLLCDSTWCVWVPEEIQLRRLTARDGLTTDEALARMRAVLSADEKANRASVIIDNSGTPEETLALLPELLDRELSRTADPPRRRRSVQSAPADSSSARIRPAPARSAPAGFQTASGHPASAGFESVPASAAAAPALGGMERPKAARKGHSGRRVSWTLPRPLTVALCVLPALLAVLLTATILMNAYLAGQREKHEAEQRSIDAHYPLYYREEIVSTAAAYNLSPALVASVILNESSFNPAAESGVGAKGLMQVMPDTADWIAHKLGYDDFSFSLMEDPAVNIRFGCWYLNYLASLFNGDPVCVVCAYHAGQGEIASWLANPLYSADGETLLTDRLPEGPTKQYAGRVTRDYGIYQAKYFSADQPDLRLSDSVSP